MGVRIREKIKGSGVYWVFVAHKGKRVSRKIGSERAANEAAVQIQAQLALGKSAFGQKAKLPAPRLRDYVKKFEEVYKPTVRPNTWRIYSYGLRINILPELGKYRLDEISKSIMKDLVAKLVNKGLAKKTIQLSLAALAVLYELAIDDGIVSKNPTKKLAKFYRRAPSKEGEIAPLTEEENLLFLKTVLEYHENWYPFFLCSLHTGMRIGEVAGLQWGDVDWASKFIEVKRQSVMKDIADLKTSNARRRVDLSDEMLETLKNLRRQRQEEAMRKGKNEISEWIFPTEDGGFMDKTAIDNMRARIFKKTIRRAGLRHFRIHDLRHTFASQLLCNGANILYVSQQLGHSSPVITMKIYAKWIPKEGQREAMNQLPCLSSQRDDSSTEATG